MLGLNDLCGQGRPNPLAINDLEKMGVLLFIKELESLLLLLHPSTDLLLSKVGKDGFSFLEFEVGDAVGVSKAGE